MDSLAIVSVHFNSGIAGARLLLLFTLPRRASICRVADCFLSRSFRFFPFSLFGFQVLFIAFTPVSSYDSHCIFHISQHKFCGYMSILFSIFVRSCSLLGIR